MKNSVDTNTLGKHIRTYTDDGNFFHYFTRAATVAFVVTLVLLFIFFWFAIPENFFVSYFIFVLCIAASSGVAYLYTRFRYTKIRAALHEKGIDIQQWRKHSVAAWEDLQVINTPKTSVIHTPDNHKYVLKARNFSESGLFMRHIVVYVDVQLDIQQQTVEGMTITPDALELDDDGRRYLWSHATDFNQVSPRTFFFGQDQVTLNTAQEKQLLSVISRKLALVIAREVLSKWEAGESIEFERIIVTPERVSNRATPDDFHTWGELMANTNVPDWFEAQMAASFRFAVLVLHVYKELRSQQS